MRFAFCPGKQAGSAIQVELDEGPRLTANAIDRDAIAVGQLVKVVFDDIDAELTLPRFRLLRQGLDRAAESRTIIPGFVEGSGGSATPVAATRWCTGNWCRPICRPLIQEEWPCPCAKPVR